jgi:hypothetical protein
MNITDIIADLQKSYCLACKIGKALVALKGLDQAEPDQSGLKRIKPDKIVQTTAIKNYQAKPKAPKRGVHGKVGESRHIILEYLARHPGSKTADIAEGTGLPKTTVAFHLLQAHKKGILVHSGHRLNSTWSMAHKPTAEPDRVCDIEDDELICKFCKSPSASKERLQRHYQLVHGKVI